MWTKLVQFNIWEKVYYVPESENSTHLRWRPEDSVSLEPGSCVSVRFPDGTEVTLFLESQKRRIDFGQSGSADGTYFGFNWSVNGLKRWIDITEVEVWV